MLLECADLSDIVTPFSTECQLPRRSIDSCSVQGFSGKQMFIAGCSLGGCISVNAICQEVWQLQLMRQKCHTSRAAARHILRKLMVLHNLNGMCDPKITPLMLHSNTLQGIESRNPCMQGKLFSGAALFAPMLSLERASQHGLNYYLR